MRSEEVTQPQPAVCKQPYIDQKYLIAKRLHGLSIRPAKQAAKYIAHNACQPRVANSYLNIYKYADKL